MHVLFFSSDSCKKTAVVLTGAIGTVEFINCQSMECQVQAVSEYFVIDETVMAFISPCTLCQMCFMYFQKKKRKYKKERLLYLSFDLVRDHTKFNNYMQWLSFGNGPYR